jgi:hypothetical protein
MILAIIKKLQVSETGFCLCLQAEPTQMGSIEELVSVSGRVRLTGDGWL